MPLLLLVLGALVLSLAGAAPVAAVADEPDPPPIRAPTALPDPPPPGPRPRVITIAAAGDIALSGPGDPFTSVRRALRADVVLGNLEGTLSTAAASKCGGAPAAGCYAFRAPTSSARVLARAGFTVLNLANNHANDYGSTGLAQTTAALAAAHLGHTGRPGQVAYRRIHRVRIAFVGFAPYPWAQSLLDLHAAARLVHRAAERADVVVVTMHAGAEGSDRTHVRPGEEYYLGERRGNVVAFAHTVVRAGADLVVGHGPHVLRGMEWYRGRLIAYSLGNFAGQRTLSVAGILGTSAILRVTLRPDGAVVRSRLVPVRLVDGGTPKLDTSRAGHALVRQLSREDFRTSAVRVLPGGILR